ncbi:MAG: hypothetical protein IJX67_02830 [Oscillospiraceae bacterium]|nr:hypothetical protein [Oscillospiraceae bacterium]
MKQPCKVAGVGYLVEYIHIASGRHLTIAVGDFLLLMVFLPDLIFASDKRSKEKSE